MAKARLHLTFPERLIDEPVIYRLVKEFEVVPNIRRANVEERFAWVILELDGSEEALTSAVGWLEGRGVQVARLEGDG